MGATFWMRGSQLLVELDRIAGRQGPGVHILTLHLKFQGRRDLVECSLQVGGSLSLVLSNRGPVHLGPLYASSSPPTFSVDPTGELYDPQAQFSVDLSPIQLEAIEEARTAQDVEFQFDINGLIVGSNLVEPFFGQLRLRSDTGAWTRVLGEMGFAKSVVLTIPVSPGGGGRAADAAGRLERALIDVSAGRYREAVRECRDLLEALYLEDREEFAEFKPTFPKSSQAGKGARLHLIREAILVLTHAAAHDDPVARSFQWERKDAQMVIGLLAALIHNET